MKPRFTNQIKNDFKEANISIHVMPLPKKATSSGEDGVGGDFNQDIFYNDLTAPYKRVDDFDLKDEETGAVDANVIADRFEMGAKKRRRYASIPLHLPGWKEREDSPGIMLDLYPAVQVRSKPQKVQVHQEKNRETNRRTKRIVTETGEEVRKEDLHHFADFCGRVSLQPANIATMKQVSNSLDDTGMVIHGFRPLKFLPTTNLMSRTILALSNDARVQGSGKALYNLKRSMIKKGVFAVGELLLRKTASSKLVALVPKNDESGSFFIMQLPFKEDLREVPKQDIGFADRKSVDAAKALISKATLHADNVKDALPANPFLQHFFGYLESVSLSKPLLKPEDEAKQDVQMMLDNASEEIEDFKTSLPPDDLPIQKAGVKRKAPAASKPKFEKEPISEEWIDMYKNNEIADLKNDKLKEFLKGQGERMGGKKSDLVDRINRCIQKEVFK